MAVNAGQNRRSFIDLHEELTTTLQLKLMEYVKTLLEPLGNGAGDGPLGTPKSNVNPMMNGAGPSKPSAASKKSAGKSKYEEIETRDGWPVMPEVNETDLKESLEDLLRGYLTAQYSESCRSPTRSADLDENCQNAPRETGRNDCLSVRYTKTHVNSLTRNITRRTSSLKIRETSGKRPSLNSADMSVSGRKAMA